MKSARPSSAVRRSRAFAVPRGGRLRALAVLLAVLGAAASSARADSLPTYTLGPIASPVVRNTTDATTNAWLTSNYVVPVRFVAAADPANLSLATVVGQDHVQLNSDPSGFVVDRIQPEYYLGEPLEPPAKVDWAATYAFYTNSPAEQAAFLFDPQGRNVYVTRGGNYEFTWIRTDGTTYAHTYVLAGVAQTRPFRIFWTEPPYNAPAVDLSGKFVKFYGDPDIIEAQRGTVTNASSSSPQILTNAVVSGLFLDPDAHALRVFGTPRGQVVMAYYDTGAYDTIKAVQVIEVAQPDVTTIPATIGRAIRPSGAGYAITNLVPFPQKVDTGDLRGDYYYQHRGEHAYSPKNNAVFPLRPTDDFPAHLPVYWEEYDPFGTLWPFELDHYAASWPTDAQLFLRGDAAADPGTPLLIPDDYSASLCEYQDPPDHARAPVDGQFSTSASGFSLLKLTANDNIWFIPVHSVLRTETNFFTLIETDWPIGTEIDARGGSIAGVGPAFLAANATLDDSLPGYIYPPVSGRNYNPQLYHAPSSAEVSAATTNATFEYPSVIYAVTTDDKPLEVWWRSTLRQPDMPEPLIFPVLPQVYRACWPGRQEAPQIVLASQQGSAYTTYTQQGSALEFDDAPSSLALPDRAYFSDSGFTIAFSLRPDWETLAPNPAAFANARLLQLGGTSGDSPTVTFDFSASGTSLVCRIDQPSGATNAPISLELPLGDLTALEREWPDEPWHDYALSFDNTDHFAVWFDNCLSTVTYTNLPDVPLEAHYRGNVLGAANASISAPAGLVLDSLAIHNYSRSVDEIIQTVVPGEFGLTFLATFDEPGDLEPNGLSDRRTALDTGFDTTLEANRVFKFGPGAPALAACILHADAIPVVYHQPDPAGIGYNPNEEHAFVRTGSGGYVVWALRCDLNVTNGTGATSAPGVLVQYPSGGRMHMRWLGVFLTDSTYDELFGFTEVGRLLPGPHPLDLLDNPWCTNDYWDAVSGQDEPCAFRDHLGAIWSRAAGELPIHMYYPMQENFWFPSLATNKQPAVGTPIPWLSALDSPADANVLVDAPATWTWHVGWPDDLPVMRIGQTLTTAANGLPEVWNAKSIGLVYPGPSTADSTVILYDPTVIQSAALPGDGTVADRLAKLGFYVGNGGNMTFRAGKYRFSGLPPTISSRFYVDSTRPADSAICFLGTQETSPTASFLLPNILAPDERQALKDIVPSTLADASLKTAWDTAIAGLATAPVKPGDAAFTTSANPELHINYVPRDHYALTAVGGTNYVVLIENDSTNKLMNIPDGTPVSMHVFAVTNEYFAGAVLARQDPENLLSEQLSVLYTEAFAGHPENFIFEWRRTAPPADGNVPTNFLSDYSLKFPLDDTSVGLTRFVLGAAGASLTELVNTYYACRYRAASTNSPAYAVMTTNWSDWCGPTLAEGWVQRVLNNVTPFTQRMQDLYENKAETDVTAIQAAGAPYVGPVALNQDNLNNVGLIQLYQTVLDRAESMSLALGINDGAANSQLLLAAERLADLYVLLGNEAYADALNPTIGFDSDGDTASPTTGNTADSLAQFAEYSTSLFSFDNQVASLLDEELALLRGRTGADAPSVRTAPFYNRLAWNYTKGITAGEVAYVVNYNITSENGDALVDATDAARQFPQGHGDAYGHYLSALAGWYRLLRNPNFSWGAPTKTEMLLADAVANVDYYDEERFAETAAKLATAAEAVVDLTARKAYLEGGDAIGAGYLDTKPERGFGYGEWATRGGVGAALDWVVANSLLPASDIPGTVHQLVFEPETFLFADGDLPFTPDDLGDGAFTFELSFNTLSNAPAGNLLAFSRYHSLLVLSVDPASAQLVASTYELLPQDTVVGTTEEGFPITEHSILTNRLSTIPVAPCPTRGRLALVHVPADAGFAPDTTLVHLYNDINGAHNTATLPAGIVSDFTHGDTSILLGGGYSGILDEFRVWDSALPAETLDESPSIVAVGTDGLLAYLRTWTDNGVTNSVLADLADPDIVWNAEHPLWTSADEATIAEAFADAGLSRIDRATAVDLRTLAASAASIQDTLDRLDAGLNPIGLSSHAIPFDITPLEPQDDNATHFEQIYDRAVSALQNAAAVLDRAQVDAGRLRMLQNYQIDLAATTRAEERDYNARLVDIYGYPYAGDIGPSGTYPQGYDGPDLLHYMWVDLEPYGLSALPSTGATNVFTYDISIKNDNLTEKDGKFWNDKLVSNGVLRLTYELSANGLIQKPASVTGSRRAGGQLQIAYGDFIAAYVDVQNALAAFNHQVELTKTAESLANLRYRAVYDDYAAECANSAARIVAQTVKFIASLVKASTAQANNAVQMMQTTINFAAPHVVGAGLTINTDPSAIVNAIAAGPAAATRSVLGLSEVAAANVVASSEYASEILDYANDISDKLKDYVGDKIDAYKDLADTVSDLHEAYSDVLSAWAACLNAYRTIDNLIAEGDLILADRAAHRASIVNTISRLRYRDMFFRQLRNAALTRYRAAFDLAQKYTYLAAQAYDYETGLLSADPAAAADFRRQIIASRALGNLEPNDRAPLLADGIGDPGLSDILARMHANWLVLKPRLGLNNPQKDRTTFSLRRELFRIGAADDSAWRTELRKHLVPDLRSLPEYRRYCQPFNDSVSSNSYLPEPGFVIPFSTAIDFAHNFFGKPLEGGDHAFDSTYFSTRIASASVCLADYGKPAEGYSGPGLLSTTPVAYLLPLGQDRMRFPGQTDTILSFNVVDQVIPLPYPVGSTQLDDPDWQPLYDGYTGGIDLAARIRKYPSFRCVLNEDALDSDAPASSSRLFGRSVWNTRWLLILPAGAMNTDRDKAVQAFLQGADLNADGTLDLLPVSDILLSLRTYSASGN